MEKAIYYLSNRDIIANIDQERVFRNYIGLKDIASKYINPYRPPTYKKDTNPSCSFYYSTDGVLLFKDWAIGRVYDCIQMVMAAENISRREAIDLLIESYVQIDNINASMSPIKPRRREIYIVEDDRYGYKYFEPYKLSKSVLRGFYNIIPCLLVEIDGMRFFPREDSPLYAIFSSPFSVKLYWPLASRDKKFRDFTEEDSLFGTGMLRKGRILFISSSAKDAASINMEGFDSIALAKSEYQLIGIEKMSLLASLYQKIILWLDNDTTGVLMSNKYRRSYPFIYTVDWKKSKYKCKDPSDLRKKNSTYFSRLVKKIVKDATRN